MIQAVSVTGKVVTGQEVKTDCEGCWLCTYTPWSKREIKIVPGSEEKIPDDD